MDLRLTFNEDPQGYDKFRPTYPSDLSKQVIELSNLSEESTAIEIGIGAGQATLPFLKTGCKIKAIEIGDELAKFVRKKYHEYNNLEVINQDFEKLKLDGKSSDLVYSASAFHWIPIETGLPKVIRILKPGGVFAWFSVQPQPADEDYHIHIDIQKVYRKFSNHFGQKVALDPEEMKKMMIVRKDNREAVFKQYGFTDIKSSFFYGKNTFSADDYVKLLSTYSDHKAMPEEERNIFMDLIKEAINKHGGFFNLSYTYILCMGRRAI